MTKVRANKSKRKAEREKGLKSKGGQGRTERMTKRGIEKIKTSGQG